MPPPSPPPAYEILPNDSRAAVLTRSGRSEVHLPSPSSPVGSESTVPQRVQNLWFDDGNIVIQAGNALYRVYRGALASRSSVFQDMISFPQPPEAELVEGCPFVELPDPEVDVTPFLRAIFEPEFFMPFPAPTEFDVVVGCLRLGHKYGVEYLRRRALVHFSSGFPTTLSQFDRYMYEPEDGPSKEHSWRFPEDPASRIRAILVAREVDAPWLLPRAFYTLAVHFDKLGMAVFNGAVYNGLDVRLSAEDQKTFSKGYIIQSKATVVDGFGFLSWPLQIEECRHPATCDLQRLKGVAYIVRDFNTDHPANCLYVWTSEDWPLLRALCLPCMTVLKKTHQDARQAFWDRLPEIYGLSPWEVLEQLKTAAHG